MNEQHEIKTGAAAAEPAAVFNATFVDLGRDADKVTVFYHGGCADGVTGAWAIFHYMSPRVQRRLIELGGLFTDGRGTVSPQEQLREASAVFIGLAHHDPPPAQELVSKRHVIYVDIAPSARTGAAVLAMRPQSLTVLDHHRSAQQTLKELESQATACSVRFQVAYDETRSGAQIAWDWAAWSLGSIRRPAFVDYVGDRDLWKFALPNSRAINKLMYTEEMTRGFGPLSTLWAASSRGSLGFDAGDVMRGEAYLRAENAIVARFAAAARPAVVRALLPGETEPREYCVLSVNVPLLASEVGDAIMARAGPKVHFAVMWNHAADPDEIWVSARTNRPDVDLSRIAPFVVGATKGGGHPTAAGFTIPGDSPGKAIVLVRRREEL